MNKKPNRNTTGRARQRVIEITRVFRIIARAHKMPGRGGGAGANNIVNKIADEEFQGTKH